MTKNRFSRLFTILCSSFIGLTICLPSAIAQGYAASEAAQRMTVAEGLQVQLIASEPQVRQPVCIEFDDRGRLWVVQYLQYPNPEGLTRVDVDRYSRTKYDRMPEPPPFGPKGADRISILSDQDGDGFLESSRDFVNGLNLTSGLAFGHRGVFVLNPPYLLYYPDRNRDDQPDSDPEVLLSGFGIEDAHSVANSLTWGPDGWLYGCQGSTVTAQIRGIEFQQGVWRYHPVSCEFELFCEGGGNSWGLDFDAFGNLLYSTNYGGHVLLHGVQGGYYVKSFAKHGALHNPHTYGYFEHAPHQDFRGGHVTVGGIVYRESGLPPHFHGKYIAGDLLGHGVHVHEVHSLGSSFRTSYSQSLLSANDTWFAPTDITTGPDGAVYVADWHDARTAHPDPDADWDRSNGRVYRISAAGAKPVTAVDFSTMSVSDLKTQLSGRNQWFVRKARAELVARSAVELIPELLQVASTSVSASTAAEHLWTAISLVKCLDRDSALSDSHAQISDQQCQKLLGSPHEVVRFWTLRYLGDRRRLSDQMAHWLDEFAEQEPSVIVRQQLACSAARFNANQALPMINANINRDIDNQDPYLPLLWWWAVEKHCISGRDEVMKRFVRPSLWKSTLGRDFLLPRLIRRYAAEGTSEGYLCVEQLLAACPTAQDRDQLWISVLSGWKESLVDPVARVHLLSGHPLRDRILQTWLSSRADPVLLELSIMLGEAGAIQYAFEEAIRDESDPEIQVLCLRLLRSRASAIQAEEILRRLELQPFGEPGVLTGRVSLIVSTDQPELTARIIELYPQFTAEVRSLLRPILLSRRSSAQLWLEAVDRGQIQSAETPLDQIRQVAYLNDSKLDALILKHWGRVEGGSREEKLAEVRRLNNDLRAADGDPQNGRLLFVKHCGTCHKLFGEGTELGPDLTTANRRDRDFLLVSLVDPNSVIRREYVNAVVATRDGRVLTGLVVNRKDGVVTLADARNQRTSISVDEIEEMTESVVSLMPDNLYRQFGPQELRDLFAWLQSN